MYQINLLFVILCSNCGIFMMICFRFKIGENTSDFFCLHVYYHLWTKHLIIATCTISFVLFHVDQIDQLCKSYENILRSNNFSYILVEFFNELSKNSWQLDIYVYFCMVILSKYISCWKKMITLDFYIRCKVIKKVFIGLW